MARYNPTQLSLSASLLNLVSFFLVLLHFVAGAIGGLALGIWLVKAGWMEGRWPAILVGVGGAFFVALVGLLLIAPLRLFVQMALCLSTMQEEIASAIDFSQKWEKWKFDQAEARGKPSAPAIIEAVPAPPPGKFPPPTN
jgi:hypothetical protein